MSSAAALAATRPIHAAGARAAIRAAAPDAIVTIHDDGFFLTLDLLAVPAAQQRQGVGSRALTALTRYADDHGLALALTPDSGFGTPRTALERLYRAHGFGSNLGRKRDFRTRQSFTRYPQPAGVDIMAVPA